MLLVRKTKRLDNKKPAQIARKFRISIEDVRELQRGETIELNDTLARTLKQWGMVAYAVKPISLPPLTPVVKTDIEQLKSEMDYTILDNELPIDDKIQSTPVKGRYPKKKGNK